MRLVGSSCILILVSSSARGCLRFISFGRRNLLFSPFFYSSFRMPLTVPEGLFEELQRLLLDRGNGPQRQPVIIEKVTTTRYWTREPLRSTTSTTASAAANGLLIVMLRRCKWITNNRRRGRKTNRGTKNKYVNSVIICDESSAPGATTRLLDYSTTQRNSWKIKLRAEKSVVHSVAKKRLSGLWFSAPHTHPSGRLLFMLRGPE